MYSPKPDTVQTIVFVTFAICFVYIMSIGISKFESCHKGDAELQKKKDYITTILTIAIIVPATLFGQRVFDSLTGEYTSALPMFFVALGVLSFVGSYFTFEIVTKEKNVIETQREVLEFGAVIPGWSDASNGTKQRALDIVFDGATALESDTNEVKGFVKNLNLYLDQGWEYEGGEFHPDLPPSEEFVKTTDVEVVDAKCGKSSSEKFSPNWWITVVAMILCWCLVLGGMYIIWKGRREEAANKAAKAVAEAVKAATPVTG